MLKILSLLGSTEETGCIGGDDRRDGAVVDDRRREGKDVSNYAEN